MAAERVPMTWQVKPRRWSDLAERTRAQYGAIIVSYGGTVAARGGFRSYRVAELCAHSVRSEVGVEADVELTDAQA